MRFNCGEKLSEEEKIKKDVERLKNVVAVAQQWNRVFTWLPVRIGSQCIWLETVERRYPNAVFRPNPHAPEFGLTHVFCPYVELGEPEYRELSNDDYPDYIEQFHRKYEK